MTDNSRMAIDKIGRATIDHDLLTSVKTGLGEVIPTYKVVTQGVIHRNCG
jgi:hypothetical protein